MRKLLDNSLFLKILSVLIAIGLWLFVLYTVKPTTQKVYKDIEITFKGEYVLDDENLAIVKDTPLKATVELKGARTDIARISNDNIVVSMNVDSIKKSGSYTLDYSVKVTGVSNNAITILSTTPSAGEIVVEPKKEKTVPLSVKVSGTLPNNDEVLDPELLMDTVVVSGPKSRINHISKAIAYLDQTHVSDGETHDLPYSLYDKDGNQIEQTGSIHTGFDLAKVTCHILHKRDVDIYPIVKGTTAGDTAIDTITTSPKTVTVIGSKDQVASLNHIETTPINVAGQSSEKTYSDITLSLPDGISFYPKTNDKLTKHTVNVTIKTAERTSKEIPITYLEAKNPADQSKFTFEKSDLTATVSGTEKNIQNADIRAIVNIEGLAPGQHVVPVELTTSGPYLTISGTYTATITVLS